MCVEEVVPMDGVCMCVLINNKTRTIHLKVLIKACWHTRSEPSLNRACRYVNQLHSDNS